MTLIREKLVDRMTAIYGLEHAVTIVFADSCERYPETAEYDKALEVLVESHEEFPFALDENYDPELDDWDDAYDECGFDPYEGCYTYDC